MIVTNNVEEENIALLDIYFVSIALGLCRDYTHTHTHNSGLFLRDRCMLGRRDIPVGTSTGSGLDDRALLGAKDLSFLQNLRTASGVLQTSYSVGTGDLSPVKSGCR